MENWRRVWREGIAPLLPTKALQALRDALAADDPRLLQGATTEPPVEIGRGCEVDGACALGFCGWHGEGLSTNGEVNRYFWRMSDEVAIRLKEPLASRYFVNWFDETPRERMRSELLPEVEAALAARPA